MKWIIWTIGLFLAVVFEAASFSLPWVLILLLLTAVFTKKEWIFFAAVGAGVLLDCVTFRTVGSTSLLLVCLLGLVFLYERKFEIKSLPFLAGITAVGTLVYTLCFEFSHGVLVVILSTIVAGIGFLCKKFFDVKLEKW